MSEATAIKEWPILFSGEMVKAILDGRKTVTRRVVKPQWKLGPCDIREIGNGPEVYAAGGVWLPLECPYGEPGSRLWVRETWRYYWDDTLWCCINYRADDARIKPDVPDHNTGHMMAERCDQSLDDKEPWKPSIHMPRWASRITLEVVSVRVERLQEITEADAEAEGFERREHFIRLWDNLNAKRGHDFGANPWVWRVEFKRLEGK